MAQKSIVLRATIKASLTELPILASENKSATDMNAAAYTFQQTIASTIKHAKLTRLERNGS